MPILAHPVAQVPEATCTVTLVASTSLVTRATYLLEYGEDVVARLALVDGHVAQYLHVQLARFAAHLHLILECRDQTLVHLLVEALDAALAPGEWLLREVEL